MLENFSRVALTMYFEYGISVRYSGRFKPHMQLTIMKLCRFKSLFQFDIEQGINANFQNSNIKLILHNLHFTSLKKELFPIFLHRLANVQSLSS